MFEYFLKGSFQRKSSRVVVVVVVVVVVDNVVVVKGLGVEDLFISSASFCSLSDCISLFADAKL